MKEVTCNVCGDTKSSRQNDDDFFRYHLVLHADLPVWYVIDIERTRVSESVVYWRHDGHGYTVDLSDAGKFTKADAEAYCREIDTIMIHESRIGECKRVVITPKSALAPELNEAWRRYHAETEAAAKRWREREKKREL